MEEIDLVKTMIDTEVVIFMCDNRTTIYRHNPMRIRGIYKILRTERIMALTSGSIVVQTDAGVPRWSRRWLTTAAG